MDEKGLEVAMKVLMKAKDSEIQEARLSHEKEMVAVKARHSAVMRSKNQEGIQIDV